MSRLRPAPGHILAAVLGGGLLALAAGLGTERLVGPVLARVEGLFVDAAFRLRHRHGRRPRIDERVVPVRIERQSIDRFGRWPWKRGVHAQLLRRGGAALKPRGVVYDVLFRGRSEPEEDAAFAAALQELGNVGLALSVTLTDQREQRLRRNRVFGDEEDALARLLPPRPGFPTPTDWVRHLQPPLGTFSKASRDLGHILSRPDADGVFRRFRPFLVVDDRVLPSLALVGVSLALDLPLENFTVEGRELVLAPGGQLAVERRFPLAEDGSMLINWAAPYGEGWSPVRAHELDGDVTASLRQRAAARLWVVGVAGLEQDQGRTPLSEGDIPLFETHLHAINSLLTGEVVREERGPLWVLACLGLLALMVQPVLRFGSVTAAALGLIPLVLYAAGGLLLFARGSVLIPFASPLLFGTGAYLGLLAWLVLVQERARERARDRLRRYFPEEILDVVMSSAEGPTLGGRRTELSILFSDIKGFTTTSEHVEPDVLGEFLGEYFDRMVEIVFRHRGTVDKFMGDGLMAFWGDPVPLEDHAERAVRAARDMQAAAVELSKHWEDRLGGAFRIRIGVNTGTVTVGNMGGQRRMEYTVLGRAVNQAQRLEANAEPGGILIGERTRALLPGDLAVSEKRMIRVKGIDQEIGVFAVLA